MKKLCIILAGLFACTCMTTAWAQDGAGFSADQVAENQGAVAYWYAVGYSYVNGQAGTWADIEAIGAPLRGFFSPHSGDAINFDSDLSGEGDMMYVAGDWGPEIHVRLSTGDIVLPGTLVTTNPAGFNDCCEQEYETSCCEISICDMECWEVCDNQEAVCKIVEWMMWKSFETFECRYGRRPCGEEEWFASGFSPIDANWREKAPYMDIEYVWKAGDACSCACILKKAYVNCCPPAPVCDPCESKCKPKCENKCEPKCKTNTCSKSKCDNKCAKPKCESKCKPKCENKCKPKCESKCKTNTCNKCVKPCDNKCGKPKCDNKCAKPKCESKCKPKCENKCKPKCESKCKTNTCNKCVKPCDNKCGKPKCDDKCAKPKCNSCEKPKCGSKCDKPKCNSCEKPKCGSKCDKPKCNSCEKPKCGKCG